MFSASVIVEHLYTVYLYYENIEKNVCMIGEKGNVRGFGNSVTASPPQPCQVYSFVSVLSFFRSHIGITQYRSPPLYVNSQYDNSVYVSLFFYYPRFT